MLHHLCFYKKIEHKLMQQYEINILKNCNKNILIIYPNGDGFYDFGQFYSIIE